MSLLLKNKFSKIKLVAIFSIFIGLIHIFGKNSSIYHLTDLIKAGDWVFVPGLLFETLYIVAGIGLLNLFSWGQKLFIGLAFFYLVSLIWNSFQITKMNLNHELSGDWFPLLMLPQYFLAALFFITSLVYITLPEVRKQFD